MANWLIVTLGAAVLVERLPELRWSAFDRNARFAAWLLLATAGFVVLQILPLPRGLWAAMPGHALAAQIADAAGSGGWTAWSLSPDRTIEALAGLVPFAAALAIAARADGAQRLALLRLVLVVALASAVLAVIQVGAGPGSAPMLFASRHRGLGVGLFVNRNHFALFLLFAMLIAALPGVPAFIRKVQNPAAAEWGLRLGASLLLTLGVIATLSRAGMFLLPVALTAAFLISRRGRVRVPLLVGGIVLAGLAALLLRSVPVVQVLLERFATAAEDFRFQYWANTLDAARDALPFGTGLGTFTLVYPQFEPLDQMRPDVVNHAHNDVLELLLEGGIAAALLLLAWIVFVALAAGRARKVATTRRERYVPLVAAIAAGLAFAASLVDYPLRMSAIAVTLALLVGMACRIAPVQAAAAQESQGRARHWALATPLVLAALLALSSDWARQFAAAGQPRLATGIAPWSGEVQSAAATRYQVMGENAAASRAARRALAVSPLDPAAVRAEGMAALALGRAEQGAALLSLGARLGWRDVLNQLWLVEQALAANAHGFAIQRIDGIVRQNKFGDELLPYLPPLLQSAEGRTALAEQLALRPNWRVPFFNTTARDSSWRMPQLLDLLARLRRLSAPADQADTALIQAVLAARGQFGDVRRVWSALGSRAAIGDGDFERSRGSLPAWAAPHDWWAPALTGVRSEAAAPQIARAGRALSVMSDGVAQGGALAQTIVLEPGRYVLGFSVMAQDAALPPRLSATIACRRDGSDALGPPLAVRLAWRPGRNGWQAAQGVATIPVGCPGQVIMVSIPETGGRPFSLWIDDVSIRSAAQPGA